MMSVCVQLWDCDKVMSVCVQLWDCDKVMSVCVQLKPRELRPIKDKEPCLLHLRDWDEGTGDEGTVEDLALRLHQIGRSDIARALAQAVYQETSREIHK